MMVGDAICRPVMAGKCAKMASKSKKPVVASKPTEVEFSGLKMLFEAVKKVTVEGILPKSSKMTGA